MPIRGLLILCLCVLASLAQAAGGPGRHAVASAHPLATEAGIRILEQGGNAFDAAVAVSAVLAVVEPYSSGIGGGGFWLLHQADSGRDVMIDGRERAPLAATRNLYLDASGRVVPGLSMNGPLAAGIPGEPAALAHIARRYGRLPLSTTLAPAIRLAREGFEIDPVYRRLAAFRLDILREHPAAARIFLQDGEVPPPGWRLRQPALAGTLEALARQGRDGFYAGEVAKRLVNAVRGAGGIWTLEDLRSYRVVEREPIRIDYRGWRILAASPPSSGGVVLGEMLNILAGYDLAKLAPATRVHLLVEAMRRAYRDRAEYLGDPDFVAMPLARLLHPFYAAGLRAGIRLDRATPSDSLRPVGAAEEGPHTTHFSILDAEGNRVAATLSINYPFGSGFVAGDTGVLLNDEMDDFAAAPGAPNAYGLVGAEANAIAPGKRMLSSMTPTFVEGPDRIGILGTPGGSRIITMVLLGVLDLIDGGDPEHWVSLPRFHHQYLPDAIQFEPDALPEAVQQRLQAMGHRLQPLEHTYGNMQAILWHTDTGEVAAASDPRGIGRAVVIEAE